MAACRLQKLSVDTVITGIIWLHGVITNQQCSAASNSLVPSASIPGLALQVNTKHVRGVKPYIQGVCVYSKLTMIREARRTTRDLSLGHEIANIYHFLCTVVANGVGVIVTAFQNRYRCAECQPHTCFESTFVVISYRLRSSLVNS